MKQPHHRNPYRQNQHRPRRPAAAQHTFPRTSLSFSNATAILTLLATLTVWFTSPISDAIAQVALYTVPLTSDVDLGLSTWNQDMKYKFPPVYDHWSVGEIGSELVQGRATREYCRTQRGGATSDGDSYYSNVIHSEQTCMDQIETYPWSFRVVHSTHINAFALPGGIICVTDALLQTLDLTRGEIAALLGHEMGHVLHRHSQAQLMKKNLLYTILHAIVSHLSPAEPNTASSGSGTRSGATGARSAADGTTMGDRMGDMLFQGIQFLGEMKFSRANEYEADTTAWDLLVSSRTYDPRNVQNLLQKLWSLEGASAGGDTANAGSSSSSGKMSWEMTHPGTADRIEALQAKWESSQQQRSQYY